MPEALIMDPRVTELHCIMPIANIESVMARGILSYEQAAKLKHRSVAMQPVQDKRDQRQVPRGLKLHQYANLYFHARNPMLYKRLPEVAGLCVLRISADVFGLPGTVITDCNAASDYVRFLAPAQWRLSISMMFTRMTGDTLAIRRGTFSIALESAPKYWCLTGSRRNTFAVRTSRIQPSVER